ASKTACGELRRRFLTEQLAISRKFAFDGNEPSAMLCVPREAGQQQSSGWRSSWLRAEPISVSIDEGRFLLCTGRDGRSLTVHFWISSITTDSSNPEIQNG